MTEQGAFVLIGTCVVVSFLVLFTGLINIVGVIHRIENKLDTVIRYINDRNS